MPVITDISYREALAGAIRAEFGRRGINRTELAAVLGVSRPTAALRWRGTEPYDADQIQTVANFLGVTVDNLNESAAFGVRTAEPKPDTSPVEQSLPARDVWEQPARSKRSRKTA